MSTPASDPSGFRRPAGGRTQPGRRRLITALLVLALVAAAVIAVINLGYDPNRAGDEALPVATQDQPPTVTPFGSPSETPPSPLPIPGLPAEAMNILVVGSDSRGNAREDAAHTANTAESSDHRSDALMVVHVPADRQSLYVVSVNRDLWVEIPNYGCAKINAALQLGGLDLLDRTIARLFGIHISHSLMMDFNGFRALIDGLGGIDVHVTLPFQSTHDTQRYFPPGANHLTGQAALEFARERYAFTDGDFQRVRNQQTLLKAILPRLTSGGALHDVTAVRSLVDFAACCLTLDGGFDPIQAAILAYSLRDLDSQRIGTMTLPTAGSGFIAGQSVLLPDYDAINTVGAALRNGRISELARH